MILKLVVDLDNVFNKKDSHHNQFINNTNDDRTEKHYQEAVIAVPFGVGIAVPATVGFNPEQHKEAGDKYVCGCINVEELQNLLNHKRFEVEYVVQEFAEAVKPFSFLCGNHGNSQNDCRNES